MKKLTNIIAGSILSLFLVNCTHQTSKIIINNLDNKIYSQIEYAPKFDIKKDKLPGTELATIEFDNGQIRVSYYDMLDNRYTQNIQEYFVYSYDVNNNNIPDIKVFYKIIKKNKADPKNSKVSRKPKYAILFDETTREPLKLYGNHVRGSFSRNEVLKKYPNIPPMLNKNKKIGHVTKKEILGKEYFCQDYDLNRNGKIDVMAFSETKKSNPKYLLILNREDEFMQLWEDIDLNGSFDKIVNK